MFYKVGGDVIAATDGKQRPEISISMYEQYALVPGASRPVAAPPAGPAVDEVAWSFLKDTGNADQLRRFIAQFPASPRRREAKERLTALREAQSDDTAATFDERWKSRVPEATRATNESDEPVESVNDPWLRKFGYVVQVTVVHSEADAQSEFRRLQAKYSSVLGGREPLIRRKDLGERGVFFVAQVGPFGAKSEADQLCGQLKSAGGTCFVEKK
jgi:hypothetical protein